MGRADTVKVVAVATGGTLECWTNPQSGVKSIDESADLPLRDPGAIGTLVRVERFARVASNAVTGEMLCNLARTVHGIHRNDAAGVIVTHGTDTLEETAFFLDLIGGRSLPLVLTGAWRAPDVPMSDAFDNVRDAIICASQRSVAKFGAVVVMNRQVHLAREVAKVRADTSDSLSSGAGGPIAQIVGDGIEWYRQPSVPPSKFDVPPVLVLTPLAWMGIGDNGDTLRMIAESQAAGVVVAGFGSGNVPPSVIDVIGELRSKDVEVVIASRVPQGVAKPDFAGVGGGIQLKELGCVLSGFLSAVKARLLLSLLLSHAVPHKGIVHQFALWGSGTRSTSVTGKGD